MIDNKLLKCLKRKADQITSNEDITTTDDVYLDLSRKIFVDHYGKKYKKLNLSLYQTGSFKHAKDSKKMVTPHFVRDDGTVIYIQLVHNDIYLKQIYEETLNLSMEILKVKKASLFTIILKPTFSVSSISTLKPADISKCYQKITEKKFIFPVSPKETSRPYSLTLQPVLTTNNYVSSHPNKRRKIIISNNTSAHNIPEKISTEFSISDLISASKLSNFALGDTFEDWCDLYYQESQEKRILGNGTQPIDDNNFYNLLMKQGKIFENGEINIIRKMFKEEFVTIVEDMNNYKNNILMYADKTIQEIMKGTPIIYQGMLINRTGQLVNSYGLPDLIIRSDYLDKFIEISPYDDLMKKFKAPNLKGNYHYVIVDIKWTTLDLCVDGIRLRNSGRMHANKVQLYVYNHALGQIQGYEPTTSFILGRGYKFEVKGNVYADRNSFARLGHIQYDEWDKDYINTTIAAINWIKYLRTNGKKWKLLPKPSVPELYPNMSSISESKWFPFKNEVADKLGEISMLWHCGPKNRKIAHQKGIYSFRDEKCTAETVGICGPKQAPILNEIININKKTDFSSPIDRLKITLNKEADNRWMDSYKLRISVDFETIGNIFDNFEDLPFSQDTPYIFMIGVAYQGYGQQLKYQMFLVSELTKNAEFQLVYQFYQFLREITDQYLGKELPIPSLYHWGHIERTFFEKLGERLVKNIGDDIEKDIELMKTKLDWYDLNKCFKDNPIVTNGCYTFGLKDVANRLADLGLIKSSWRNNVSSCSNGNTAMVMAHRVYETCKKNNMNIIQNQTMKEIRDYNKIDCVVIHEIVDLLRRKIGK